MSRPEFEDGIPRAKIEREDSLEALQTRYGNFAMAVLTGVKGIDSQAPDDVLTIGENWYQLVNMRDFPNSENERIFQRAMGAKLFGDMWPLMDREGQNISDIMKEIKDGVEAGSLDETILEKLAVLDLTKGNPPLKESDLQGRVETTWGTNGVLKGTRTLIYHVTSGYARQIPMDLHGKPDDDLSASFFAQGPKKWL